MIIWCFYQVEMTGDYTPDLMALLSADIIISTPEKWDGISRNWHSRSYVTKVHSVICQPYLLRQSVGIPWFIIECNIGLIRIVFFVSWRLGLWFWMKFTYLELIVGQFLRYAFNVICSILFHSLQLDSQFPSSALIWHIFIDNYITEYKLILFLGILIHWKTNHFRC